MMNYRRYEQLRKELIKLATTIKLENSFADNTKRNLSIGTFSDNNPRVQIATVKANIAAINAATDELKDLYYSVNGASFIGITGAEIIVESKTEIDLS